jgi:acetyl esterase/lipase
LLGKEPGSDDVSEALDLFVEEDLEYARRLIRTGVPTELHVYPGAFHGFQWAPQADVSRAASRDSANALARAMALRGE